MIYFVSIILLLFAIGFISYARNRVKVVNKYPGFVVADIKEGFLCYDNDEIKIVRGKKVKEFNKRDINKCEIYVDEEVVSRGKRAVVGALLLGAAGAVVGAVSGKNKISKLGIRLYVNGEYLDINFLKAKCKKSSQLYKSADMHIHMFIAILEKAN